MTPDKVGKQTLEIMKRVDWYNNWLFSFVKPNLGGVILEVGGGIGNFTKLLQNEGDFYTCDINKYYIRHLKREFPSTVKIGYGDIEKGKYFFENKKFDTVVIMNVLEHIKNDNSALENIFKLLKRGGKLIILVPAFSFSFGSLDTNLNHFRRYSKMDLEDKLEKVGFDILKTRYLNSIGILGWYFNAKMTKKTVIPERQLIIFNILARPFLIIEKFYKVPFGLSVFGVAIKK